MSDPSSDGRGVAEPQTDRSAGGEADLVRRAAEGDVASYETLYRKHVGRVHALCLRMARDRSEADDLTQETFIRVWERLGSFRGESEFSTWLHRVAVNVVVAELRRRGRWRERFDAQDVTDLAVAQPAFSAGGDLDLERAIATLSPQARLVFLLHDVEGWKHGEIAERTGLAVGTSKAHLHR
ncbi:MAG: RNA polymerase sigma factor, partial [Myxococcota bacterium]